MAAVRCCAVRHIRKSAAQRLLERSQPTADEHRNETNQRSRLPNPTRESNPDMHLPHASNHVPMVALVRFDANGFDMVLLVVFMQARLT